MATSRRTDNERKLHMAIVAVAAVVAVVMVGAAAWALTRPLPPGALIAEPTLPSGGTTTGAIPTTSTGTVPTSTPASPGSTAGTTPVNPPAATGTTPSTPGRRIAFHIGNTLYISSENGKSKTPMHIVGTNYSLSPDGLSVAAVEKGKLVVATVGQHLLASSPSTPGLAAEAVAPIWLPDSSGVIFLGPSQDGTARVERFDRSSGAVADLGGGAGAAISPDGKTIATLPSESDAAPLITVARLGSVGKSFKVPQGDPVAIALGKDRVYVSTVTAAGTSELWSFAYDGSKKRKLVGADLAGSTAVTYGELIVSPDGSKLLFAADGDDGYSRLWIVPTSGGTATAISGRRDGYAIGWTKDGKGILFVEGNAFQGQSTSLWVSDLKGHNRKLLVQGASL